MTGILYLIEISNEYQRKIIYAEGYYYFHQSINWIHNIGKSIMQNGLAFCS
jgi:hypothetical protein